MRHTIYILAITVATGIAKSTSAQFAPAAIIDTARSAYGNVHRLITADINGDGRSDVIESCGSSAVSARANQVRFYTGKAGGGFSAMQTVPGPFNDISAITTADYNGDGRPDLAVADKGANVLHVYLATGGIYSTRSTITSPRFTIGHLKGLISRDFTGDGRADLLVLDHVDALLLRGLGAGAFDTVRSLVPAARQTEYYDMVAGNFNGDAFPDFAISSSGFQVYLNDGAGAFSFTSTNGIGLIMHMTAGDISGDGLDDIVVKHATAALHLATGSGAFGTGQPLKPANTAYKDFSIGDMDADGKADLYAVYDQQNRAVWFRNTGAGTLDTQQIIQQETLGSVNACALADLNGDDLPEPIWASTNGRIGYHLNMHPATPTSAAAGSGIAGIKVYPNPASGILWIQSTEIAKASLWDVTGRCMASSALLTGRNALPLHCSAGTYLLRITCATGEVRMPVIICP